MNKRLLVPMMSERLWYTSSADFLTDREFMRHLPALELETVYLKKGENAGRHAALAVGQDVKFVRYVVHEETVTSCVVDPEWGCVSIPISWGDTPRINGNDLGPDDIICWNQIEGYASYRKSRDVITVCFRKTRICAALSALSGAAIDPQHLPSEVRQVEPKIRNTLTVGLLRMLEACFQNALGKGVFALTDYQEARIIDGIARHILHDPTNEDASRPATSNSLRVVHKAMKAFADQDRPPTISDLCAASGVGVTWLHRCFQDVCGAPPAQYILERRLSAARERLLDRDTPARSVKDVSLALGFDGPGRFAQYYKRTFGELPSETLLRSGTGR
jgi:AraC-like DNA-binding protein